MIVKFATLCEHCKARSEEYTAWPTCTECMRYTCTACMEPDTLSPGDGDRGDECQCRPCALTEQAQIS